MSRRPQTFMQVLFFGSLWLLQLLHDTLQLSKQLQSSRNKAKWLFCINCLQVISMKESCCQKQLKPLPFVRRFCLSCDSGCEWGRAKFGWEYLWWPPQDKATPLNGHRSSPRPLWMSRSLAAQTQALKSHFCQAPFNSSSYVTFNYSPNSLEHLF